MKTATIKREPSTNQGTFGTLTIDGDDFACVTGELPWRNNAKGLSSIPPGRYVCKWTTWHKIGPCYELQNVPGRGGILIHIGNYCGDKNLGYRTDIEGCILLGRRRAVFNGQTVVNESGPVVRAFNRLMDGNDFALIIED